eukprot:gene3811-7584_t
MLQSITLIFLAWYSVSLGDMSEDTILHQQLKSDLYYQNQKAERLSNENRMMGEYLHINPNFPCIFGANAIGTDHKLSIEDGHKYACGLHVISGRPIVYSFGSNQQVDFEEGILDIRPDADIHIYEINKLNIPPPKSRHHKFHYNLIGLGYGGNAGKAAPSGAKMDSLQHIMKLNHHSYIDILKMDIEGFEWTFLEQEEIVLSHIGQILIEIHLWEQHPPEQNLTSFLDKLEEHDFRLFHKEGNWRYGRNCCSEWSFIRKDWYQFEKSKNTTHSHHKHQNRHQRHSLTDMSTPEQEFVKTARSRRLRRHT